MLLRLAWCKWRIALTAEPLQYLRRHAESTQWQTRTLPAGCTPAVFAARCSALVALAARQRLVQATCLPQALVLQQVLRQHGVAAQLQVGARRTPEGGISAHAWVEAAGALFGGDADMYTRFPGFSSRALVDTDGREQS